MFRKIIVGFLMFLYVTDFSVAQHLPTLWGTTSLGGTDDFGSLFHYAPSSNALSTDYSLPNLAPGANPEMNDLVSGGNGKYYGLTTYGGDNLSGVLFEWDSLTNTYTKKIDFSSASGNFPKGSLLLYGGKFYGMTSLGGVNNKGVIFEWNPVTNVYTKKFDLSTALGSNPTGSLTLSGVKLYGLTTTGGANNKGALFEWDPVTNVYTKKFDFITASGVTPYGTLEMNGAILYGMTYSGGASNSGVIFQFDPVSGTYTKKIDLVTATGKNPYGKLVYNGSKFYGLTNSGGTANRGVIFEWDPVTNVYTKKKDLTTALGSYPQGNLSFYGGKFYGVTRNGGSGDMGVIFEWDPATNVYVKKADLNTSGGKLAYGSLLFNGGTFYGMTNQGGTFGYGTLFEWSSATNVLSKRVEFNSNMGQVAKGSLLYYSGKFYGCTSSGGQYNYGVLFEWDPSLNQYTRRIDLDSVNGGNPTGTMAVSGTKLYGTCSNGGANGAGVIFEWDPATNVYAKKIDLSTANGSRPHGALLLYSTKFYGLTSSGGANGLGVIFEWDPVSNVYTKKIDLSTTNGSAPEGSLALNGTKMYGMTSTGGVNDAGVIFEWVPSTNVYAVKKNLDSLNGDFPRGTMVLNGSSFYGLTNYGGIYNSGVIFQWNPATNVYVKKIDFDYTSGAFPNAAMTLYSASGTFFGTTSDGGNNNKGVLFEWNPGTNVFTKKLDFNGTNSPVLGTQPFYNQLVEAAVNLIPVYSNTSSVSHVCRNNNSTATFTVTDGDNDAITFSSFSSNTSLVPVSGITISNTGGTNYQVVCVPVAGQSGSTTITVTANDGYGGISSYSFTLYVHAPPALSISASPVSVCPGQSEMLIASGASTYVWTGGVTNGTSFVPAATATYTVTGTDIYGCTNTSNVTVPVGVPTITVNSATICSGSSVNLTAAGGSVYSWTTGAGTASISVSPTTTASYTVTGSVGTCSGTAVATVTVNPAPAVTANATATTVCQGQPVTLTGGGATTYSWTGGVTNGTAFTPAATTTYTVTGTSSGCSATATKTITVNPVPAVTANATATTICQGQPVTLTGGGATTYSWTGGITNGTAFTPAATTTYTVTGTASGCSATATKTITVNPVPAVTANATATTICQGQPVTLTGVGATTYSWTGGITNGTAFTPAATSTYTVTGTSSGCSATATKTITVNPVPVVTANATATTVCQGQPVTLTGGGATTYSWTGGITDSTSFTPAATASYTVTGTASGCSATATASIIVTALPVVVANSSADSVCEGQTVILTGSGASTYTWTSGITDGVAFIPASGATYTVTGTSSGCSSTNAIYVAVTAVPLVVAAADDSTVCYGQSVVLNGDGAAAYAWSGGVNNGQPFIPVVSATYTVTGTSNGCSASASVSITVDPPVVTDAGVADTICFGGSLLLSASPGGAGYLYSWSSSATLDNASSQQPLASPASTTTYIVSVTDMNGCTGTDSVVLFVDPELSLAVSSQNTSCTATCDGSATVAISGGTPSYLISWSSGSYSATETNLCAGTFSVSVTDTNGCSVSYAVVINTPAPFDLSVTQNADSLVANANGLNYQWIDCNHSSQAIAGATGQVFVPLFSGNYAVVLSDGISCNDTSICYSMLVTGISAGAGTGWNVYPNPTTGVICVKGLEGKKVNALLYNEPGQLLFSGILDENGLIDLGYYENGSYVIKLISGGEIIIQRIQLVR